MSRKLFCELGPTAYNISVYKGIIIKNIKDFLSGEKFTKSKSSDELEYIIKSHASLIVRKLHGVDIQLQKNKEENLRISADCINGTLIYPGETFSFWKTIGYPTKERGFKEGLTISSRRGLGKNIGGGICQMANMIHWLVLHSPLDVTEKHHHSDAIFPDEKRRVPFGTGTSVFYNTLDYKFKNNTNSVFQLLIWVKDGYLCGEIRSDKPVDSHYRIFEEDHHFRKEGDDYYRISKVYRSVTNNASGETETELILDNHSKVLYDYSLIPENQIRND